MNKIGLKLWNINTDYYFDEARRLYDEGVFDYIELYIVPDNVDKLEKWKTLKIPFDIHAPHYAHKMNLAKPEFLEQNMRKAKEVLLYANELSADRIVFHGGSGGSYIETAKQLKIINDNRILIENKPYETLPFVNEPYYTGAKINEIKYIMEKTGCGLCLDIGHCICAANSFKIDPFKYISDFVSLHPQRIHLSGIHIETNMDEHLHYREGNLDYKKLFDVLPENINITIETKKDSKTDLNDYKEDALYLKKLLSVSR